jgi:hypothetical protein
LRPIACSSVWNCGLGSKSGAIIRLSKSINYLIDNFYRLMLSAAKECGQEESGWSEASLPDSGMNNLSQRVSVDTIYG